MTVIGRNNEVNSSVNAYNITNVRNITFFDIISYWYVKIIFTMFVCELSCTKPIDLSLIHISEPTRLGMISYAVFCLKKKKNKLNEKYSEKISTKMIWRQ